MCPYMGRLFVGHCVGACWWHGLVGPGEILVGDIWVWVIAISNRGSIVSGSASRDALSVRGFVVVEILIQCGECSGSVAIDSSRTMGVAPCVCGGGADVAHAFAHAPWCPECGEDITDCVCNLVMSCDQCDAIVNGFVCRDCVSCPEPAGYWAWDRETAREYLIGVERAAAGESDPEIMQALVAHHAVMADALGMTEDGE